MSQREAPGKKFGAPQDFLLTARQRYCVDHRMMKLIPYGQSNYKTVATQNFYYVDKTRYLELLEQMGTRFLFFLRPRRFGKSLFVSMLRHYYDRNLNDEFEALFGHTYIGQHPTPLRNAYPVLFFTFSGIKTYGTIEETIASFNLSIHAKIRTFLTLNKTYLEITDQEFEKILSIQDSGDQLRELIDMMYGHIPTDILDENVRIDYGKLKFLMFLDQQINGNFYLLKDLLEHEQLQGTLVKSIAVGEEIEPNRFLSLMYFLGLATIRTESSLAVTFAPPNLLILKMLWDYLRKATEDAYRFKVNMYQLRLHLTNLAARGEWQGTLTYILDKFYQAASARDFVFHEEGVKMFLPAYLNLADMYRVESEKAFEQGYSDIFLYPDVDLFPDVRYGYIFELKYLKSRDINTERKKQAQTNKALLQAKQQLARYADTAVFKRPVKKVAVVLCAHEVLAMEEIATP